MNPLLMPDHASRSWRRLTPLAGALSWTHI